MLDGKTLTYTENLAGGTSVRLYQCCACSEAAYHVSAAVTTRFQNAGCALTQPQESLFHYIVRKKAQMFSPEITSNFIC